MRTVEPKPACPMCKNAQHDSKNGSVRLEIRTRPQPNDWLLSVLYAQSDWIPWNFSRNKYGWFWHHFLIRSHRCIMILSFESENPWYAFIQAKRIIQSIILIHRDPAAYATVQRAWTALNVNDRIYIYTLHTSSSSCYMRGIAGAIAHLTYVCDSDVFSVKVFHYYYYYFH